MLRTLEGVGIGALHLGDVVVASDLDRLFPIVLIAGLDRERLLGLEMHVAHPGQLLNAERMDGGLDGKRRKGGDCQESGNGDGTFERGAGASAPRKGCIPVWFPNEPPFP